MDPRIINTFIKVDLMHMKQEPFNDVVSAGINLTEFYMSVEWDILDVPAKKNEEYFPCCEEPYPGKCITTSPHYLFLFAVLPAFIYI